MSRNPAKRCKACGKPCKSNVRFCVDCWHARRAAKTTSSADCVPWPKKPNTQRQERRSSSGLRSREPIGGVNCKHGGATSEPPKDEINLEAVSPAVSRRGD